MHEVCLPYQTCEFGVHTLRYALQHRCPVPGKWYLDTAKWLVIIIHVVYYSCCWSFFSMIFDGPHVMMHVSGQVP